MPDAITMRKPATEDAPSSRKPPMADAKRELDEELTVSLACYATLAHAGLAGVYAAVDRGEIPVVRTGSTGRNRRIPSTFVRRQLGLAD